MTTRPTAANDGVPSPAGLARRAGRVIAAAPDARDALHAAAAPRAASSVHALTDVGEALAMLGGHTADVLVLDWEDPACGAAAACAAVRADPRLAATWIVAVVDRWARATVARREGADDVIVRPLHAPEIAAAHRLGGARGARPCERPPAAHADDPRPRRPVPLGVGPRLHRRAHQRRDRAHHRLPGRRLRREPAPHPVEHHAPGRRRVGDGPRGRGDRRPLVRPRVPAHLRRRRGALDDRPRPAGARASRPGLDGRRDRRRHRPARGRARAAPRGGRARARRGAAGVARPDRRRRRRRAAAHRARPARRRAAAPRHPAPPAQPRAAADGDRPRRPPPR